MQKYKLLERRVEKVFISPNADVNVTFAGNITKVVTALPTFSMKVKILSKLEVEKYELDPNKKWYMRISDGEINECELMETREDDYSGVKATLLRLRGYINANVTNAHKCRWITLTYRQREDEKSEAVPMTDPERLYLDFKHFIFRLRLRYPGMEYIAVAEPQQSGSWHMHVILIFKKRAPFIPFDVLRDKYWRKGYVDIQKIDDNCDNLGAYFSAYLANIEYEEGDELQEGDELVTGKDAKGREKKFIKGGRLKFYPPKMNLYRISRGIVKPEEAQMKYKELDKSKLGALTHSEIIALYNEETDRMITYKYEYYNRKIKPEVEDPRLESIRQRLREMTKRR